MCRQGQFHKADGGTNANGHVNGHANGHANGNGTGTNVKAEGLLQAMDSEGLEQEKRPRRFLPFSGASHFRRVTKPAYSWVLGHQI